MWCSCQYLRSRKSKVWNCIICQNSAGNVKFRPSHPFVVVRNNIIFLFIYVIHKQSCVFTSVETYLSIGQWFGKIQFVTKLIATFDSAPRRALGRDWNVITHMLAQWCFRYFIHVMCPANSDSILKNIESSQDTVSSTASDLQAEIKPILLSQIFEAVKIGITWISFPSLRLLS